MNSYSGIADYSADYGVPLGPETVGIR